MKKIIVGITGSVAAFKSAQLVSDLLKLNYDVDVIMTKNATKFITPLTFEALIKKPVYIDTFSKDEGYQIKHIELAKKADCFIIVPASANMIAKVANGICDDMLSTTFLASTCKKIIAPAMNTNMYDSLPNQRNIERCKTYGIRFVDPGQGLLACGDVGRGKLADIDEIIEQIESSMVKKVLKHKRVLITAGPTIENIDPVRYITNHSSGKMGYALARKAKQLGATVTLISGPTNLKVPYGINYINVSTAKEMFDAVKKHMDIQDYIIKAAAVGDYRCRTIADQKIKKSSSTLTLELTKNDDILKYIGEHKTSQIVCGFAMETTNLIENATKKCIEKNCDMLVCNDLTTKGAGFKVDTNVVTFIDKDSTINMPCMTKDELSYHILMALKAKGDKKC